MLITRTSLLISAAAVLFVLAVHTDAEAGFLCRRGMGSYAKFYRPTPFYKLTPRVRVSRAPYTHLSNYQPSAKAAQPNTPAKAQVEHPTKYISTVRAKSVNTVSAKLPSFPIWQNLPGSHLRPAWATCVVKEYLDTGVVRFRDVCTKEWAINSIENDDVKTSKIRSACLSKQKNRNGVVMFKDICTGEWAMNTVKQMALANVQ